MCVDIMAYKSHQPYVQLAVREDWYANLGPDKQQKDVVMEASVADTGAQCFIIGSNHLRGLGLDISSLLQSEINLNCANSTTAGNLGVFFAKVRGEHHKTKEVVESKTMVYVIEGDIILVSRTILQTLGCIPDTFPQVGQFLADDNAALTGRAFSVNPDPIGLMSDGTKATNMPDKHKSVEPCANAAKASMTRYKASKLAGAIPDQQEVVREITKNKDVTSTSVRQTKGECDPESDLPCSCPRRRFVEPPEEMPMPVQPATEKDWRTSSRNTSKRGHSTLARDNTGPLPLGYP